MFAPAIGAVGVTLLLAAFVLNLSRKLSEGSAIYLWMNIAGAAISSIYAWQSGTYPFVVLEAVWGLAAVVRLCSPTKRASA